MPNELTGVGNNIPVRMIYTDTKEEVKFKSITAAHRFTNVNAGSLRLGLNPLSKKRFKFQGRTVVFRIQK